MGSGTAAASSTDSVMDVSSEVVTSFVSTAFFDAVSLLPVIGVVAGAAPAAVLVLGPAAGLLLTGALGRDEVLLAPLDPKLDGAVDFGPLVVPGATGGMRPGAGDVDAGKPGNCTLLGCEPIPEPPELGFGPACMPLLAIVVLFAAGTPPESAVFEADAPNVHAEGPALGATSPFAGPPKFDDGPPFAAAGVGGAFERLELEPFGVLALLLSLGEVFGAGGSAF